MKYDVELDDEPARVLESLPVDSALAIHAELDRLAEAPLAVGRKAHFPYRPAGMIHEFWCDAPVPRSYFVTIFYHFLPGEKTIRIYTITARPYGDDSDQE